MLFSCQKGVYKAENQAKCDWLMFSVESGDAKVTK